MDERVSAYLERKQAEAAANAQAEAQRQAAAEKARRDRILVAAGLYVKEYEPENVAKSNVDDYPHYEWDAQAQKGRYYKKVAIEVTDEEYAQIQKYQKIPPKELPSNMFGGHDTKRVPKSHAELLKSDEVCANLWKWAERLESWGAGLLALIIIAGIIISFVSASVTGEFNFASFLVTAITWALYAFLEYCAYHVLALGIGALASLVQNTKLTADVLLMNSGVKNEDTE